jgi:hypothetical protein
MAPSLSDASRVRRGSQDRRDNASWLRRLALATATGHISGATRALVD